MRAIVPVNVAAVRVSRNDVTNVTSYFRGATIAFDALPHTKGSATASTGDTIALPLDSTSADPALELGVHLHWELPDFYRRGRQSVTDGPIEFPTAPNRWLVTRTLAMGTSPDPATPPVSKSWIVESDYIASAPITDPHNVVRTGASVPLSSPSGAPAMYMGRVVEVEDWDPTTENPADFLPHYSGPDGIGYRLTAIGFVGAAFSGYYPDCRSVFGFWDSFADVDHGALYEKLAAPQAVDFTATYSVLGWAADPGVDPLGPLAGWVIDEYDDYVQQCVDQRVTPTRTPLDVFHHLTTDRFGWRFSDAACVATPATGEKLTALVVPNSTACFGVLQDVVWLGVGPFLQPTETGSMSKSWLAEVELAIGNTTTEAVAALISGDLPDPGGTGLLANYELLLEALQLGILRDLDQHAATLADLAEQRHTRSFANQSGGHLWVVQAPDRTKPGAEPVELTLPLDLAEQLHVLNEAQQDYDQAHARLALARQQVFMDWVQYVQQWVADAAKQGTMHVVPTGELASFLATSASGELNAVLGLQASIGLVDYGSDDTQATVSVTSASGANTMAARLATAFATVTAKLPTNLGWQLVLTPAPSFATPTDPVLVMRGPRVEPVRRNGPTFDVAVRVDSEVISALVVSGNSGTPSTIVGPADVAAAPAPKAMPAAPDSPGSSLIAALLGEAALLSPQSAAMIANRIAPATSGSIGDLTDAVQQCLGGRSPLDSGATTAGLFAATRAADPTGPPLGPDPSAAATTPVTLHVVFSNEGAIARAPSFVGWSAQTAQPELSPTRVDPFLPVWMSWAVSTYSFARPADDVYPASIITDHFDFDDHGTDLMYRLDGNGKSTIVLNATPTKTTGAVVLSTRPLNSLADQIDRYVDEFPGDAPDAELLAAQKVFSEQPVMAQAIGSFNLEQTLRTPIPMIPVANLVMSFDPTTKAVAKGAAAVGSDSRNDWYKTSFNSLAATPRGDVFYSPLRGGFLEVESIEVIDAFGQVMELTTVKRTPRGGLDVTSSLALSPNKNDVSPPGRVYLPPRPLAPARVDVDWLSAIHNDDVAGVTDDFVEMNSHPATSPVCGWIIPNHLDGTLAFYGDDGSPIGSFGVEHDAVIYRTRPGNDSSATLTDDIGTAGAPAKGVNVHVARLMWFINGRSVTFLDALMDSIAAADGFIQPGNSTQDPALAVLIGRPLAIARAALAISTSGGVVPPSQLNSSPTAALAMTVANGWTDYVQRQANTSAGLAAVQFPARIGDLVDIDDGLVAFLPEGVGGAFDMLYTPALPDDAILASTDPIARPTPTTTKLTLNGVAQLFTVLVDPRAPVHITTGIVPTAVLSIPPDQYSEALRTLAVTFTVHPVLRNSRTLNVAVPSIAGYEWTWVDPDATLVPLAQSGADGRPVYGYSPQMLIEGWLRLAELPPPPPGHAPPPIGGEHG